MEKLWGHYVRFSTADINISVVVMLMHIYNITSQARHVQLRYIYHFCFSQECLGLCVGSTEHNAYNNKKALLRERQEAYRPRRILSVVSHCVLFRGVLPVLVLAKGYPSSGPGRGDSPVPGPDWGIPSPRKVLGPETGIPPPLPLEKDLAPEANGYPSSSALWWILPSHCTTHAGSNNNVTIMGFSPQCSRDIIKFSEFRN